MHKMIVYFLLVIACVSNSIAHNGGNIEKRVVSWKSTELAKGIYMLEGKAGNPGANLGLLVGKDGVILIDNGLPKVIEMTMKTIGKIAGGDVSFVINTHGHLDHTGGNPAYAKKNVTIVAHDNTRKELQSNKEFNQIGLPNITFNDEITFYLNGQTVNAFYIQPAHTNNDVVIYFKDANIIHAGDMFFNKKFPFIDLDRGGDIDGFIAGQKKIIELINKDTKIIPGHGLLANKKDLQTAVNMLIDAKKRVKDLVDKGMSKEEVLTINPLATYEKWSWNHISTKKMTEILYRALTTKKEQTKN
ncbi:MBL fold metallo-hydrolase [Arcobacter sp. LA11]|uniref:MBL fold metallo-hydrolase n=1 Tax=Arcobacter sp. LA11 TaxID=1898176 RepID=UPI0009F94C2C|nr:MBL fold metallo-hydrolase [Arcobacter sp. LA11]